MKKIKVNGVPKQVSGKRLRQLAKEDCAKAKKIDIISAWRNEREKQREKLLQTFHPIAEFECIDEMIGFFDGSDEVFVVDDLGNHERMNLSDSVEWLADLYHFCCRFNTAECVQIRDEAAMVRWLRKVAVALPSAEQQAKAA